MLKALFADVAQQLLQLRNVRHACAAKGLEWIARELAFAYVTTDAAIEVVGRETSEAHCASFHAAHAVPNVFSFPTVPAMMAWKSMMTSSKKCFGKLEQ